MPRQGGQKRLQLVPRQYTTLQYTPQVQPAFNMGRLAPRFDPLALPGYTLASATYQVEPDYGVTRT